LTEEEEGEAFEPAARDETVIVKQDTESPAEIEKYLKAYLILLIRAKNILLFNLMNYAQIPVLSFPRNSLSENAPELSFPRKRESR